MSPEQRFCPLCNRVFTPGEAVLRCDGCGVLHHPACWVTNNGCSTERDHESFPVAQAYGSEPPPPSRPRSGGSAQPQRTSSIRPQREATFRAEDRPAEEAPREEPVPVIGAGNPLEPLPRVRRGPAAPDAAPLRSNRRLDDADGRGSRTMPKIYGQRRVVDFWYIPAAIIVAAIVAIGVILGVEKLTDNGDNKAAVGPSSTATTTASAPAASTTASTTPAASPSGAAGGTFTVGQTLVVTGTGDCLNVRTGPSTSNDAIVCVADGTKVTVSGGPQDAGGYTWWKVTTDSGEGWAASDYLKASTSG